MIASLATSRPDHFSQEERLWALFFMGHRQMPFLRVWLSSGCHGVPLSCAGHQPVSCHVEESAMLQLWWSKWFGNEAGPEQEEDLVAFEPSRIPVELLKGGPST